MTDQTKEALPCPFCGSLTVVREGFHLCCMHCGADGPDADNDDLDEITAKWNRRWPDLTREVHVLRLRLAESESKLQHTIRHLSRIHMLLYPPPVTASDGRTFVFHPSEETANQFMARISELIRSIPGELQAVAPAPGVAITEQQIEDLFADLKKRCQIDLRSFCFAIEVVEAAHGILAPQNPDLKGPDA